MSPSRRLLNEARRLESSIEILKVLSKLGTKEPEQLDFYKAERPTALEDIEEALRALGSIAAELSDADPQSDAIYPLAVSKSGTS